MYWNGRDCTPESSSTTSSSTPPSPASDLPPSPPNQKVWSNLQSQTTKDVLQSVLRVRKTWKTLRDGETVWPLELEAALLEGLEHYQPEDCRETRMLGRFPRRNRFISDYIFNKTGIRRSAKQVGSRLQQLRESCGGEKLLHLLSPFRHPGYPESTSSADSALSSPVSPPGGELLSVARHTVMYIDLIPGESPDMVGSIHGPSPWSDSGDIVRASDHPRRLEHINPTVSFTSQAPIEAHSQFTVYSEDLILHAETVPLVLLEDQGPHPSGFIYSTRLVPKYWKVILDSPDPTRFTIFQEVVKDSTSSILFSATYKFTYPVSTRQYGPQYDELPSLGALTMPSLPNILSTPWTPTHSHTHSDSSLQRYPSTGGHCFPHSLMNYGS